MYTPAPFRADNAAREAWLVRTNPFGVLISDAGGTPIATHVPMLVRVNSGDSPYGDEQLLGSTIIGHMAKVNDHWRSLKREHHVLAVFSGPDGYVSPTVYQKDGVAPTWNYAAVHIGGPIRLVDDADESMTILRATIDLTEQSSARPWNPESSMRYLNRILSGITAFEITVTNVQSIFKLSQDKNSGVRKLVHDFFAESPRGRHQELAALMADVRGDDADLMRGS